MTTPKQTALTAAISELTQEINSGHAHTLNADVAAICNWKEESNRSFAVATVLALQIGFAAHDASLVNGLLETLLVVGFRAGAAYAETAGLERLVNGVSN